MRLGLALTTVEVEIEEEREKDEEGEIDAAGGVTNKAIRCHRTNFISLLEKNEWSDTFWINSPTNPNRR